MFDNVFIRDEISSFVEFGKGLLYFNSNNDLKYLGLGQCILIVFVFFFNILVLDLYPFLEFRNDEKFALVKDFGALDNDKLNIGVRLKPLEKTVSVFLIIIKSYIQKID